VRVTGFGAFAVEQCVVHVEGHGATGLEHLERFAMVFGADHVHAHLVVGAVAFDKALIGGARGGHDVFVAQIIEAFDAAVLGGQ